MSTKRRNINIGVVLTVIFTAFTLMITFSIAFRVNEYIHHQRSGVTSTFEESTEILANHSYKLVISMIDDDESTAIVQGSMDVYVNDEFVTSLNLSSHDWPSPGSEDAHTSDWGDVWLYPEEDSTLRVVIHKETGDQWTYTLFEDLPLEMDQQVLTYGLLSIVGIIAILILILLHLRTFGNTPTTRTFSLQRSSKKEEESEPNEMGVEQYD